MYTLTLNERQAKVAIQWLDVLSRIGMGQLEVVADHIPEHRFPMPFHNTCVQLQEFREAIGDLKMMIGHTPNSSYSISSRETTAEAKIAYDLEYALREALARDEGLVDHCVEPSQPRQIGSEPLATVEIV